MISDPMQLLSWLEMRRGSDLCRGDTYASLIRQSTFRLGTSSFLLLCLNYIFREPAGPGVSALPAMSSPVGVPPAPNVAEIPLPPGMTLSQFQTVQAHLSERSASSDI